jgi:hypothetical protein
LKTFGTTTQLTELDLSAEVSHGKFVVKEELEVGMEDFTGDLKILYVQCS